MVIGQHDADICAAKPTNNKDGAKIFGQQSQKQKVRNRDWKPQPGYSQFMLASAMESTSVLKTHAVLDSSDFSYMVITSAIVAVFGSRVVSSWTIGSATGTRSTALSIAFWAAGLVMIFQSFLNAPPIAVNMLISISPF
jgi:hypothetical protein